METIPTYTKSWTEIEWMLAEAQEQMLEQRAKFKHRKRIRDKEGCRRAAAKFSRAKGMVDVLTWVIGGKNAPDPMAGFEEVGESQFLGDRFRSYMNRI